MVASTGIYEITGTAAAPSYGQLLSSRYSLSDSRTPGTNNPVPIPTTGFNRSFWKHNVLNITGTFTQVDNIRWYTDGTIGWNLGTSGMLGVLCMSGGDAGVGTSNNYVNASGSTTTGVWALSGHTYFAGTNAANRSGTIITAGYFTAAAPLTVDSQAYLGSCYSKALVTQVAVDTDATQGTQTAEIISFRYDES